MGLAWLWILFPHLGNDGLWFSGDAVRHAANGIFWWDLLSERPSHPTAFALQYYARYPIINPTSYPPFFYLLEALLFHFVGPSPHLAKLMVLGFALIGAVYVAAWLRRWVSPEAGWGAIFFLLQPGIVRWSNAVLLNVPAMALGLAGLYHARRWVEEPDSRHLYLAFGFCVAAFCTYFPSGIVVVVLIAWILAWRQWSILLHRRALILAGIALAVIIPVVVAVSQWAPLHMAMTFPSPKILLNPAAWAFYVVESPKVFSFLILGLAALGLMAALAGSRMWARESRAVLVWLLATYTALSYVSAREPRYGLLLTPAVVILATIAVLWLGDRLIRWLSIPARVVLPALLLCLTGYHLWTVSLVDVPTVGGFDEIARYLAREAPDERVFYDGEYDGNFGFYVRAGDPGFRRGIVRGSKLLYASAIFDDWRLREYVSSPAEVVDVLRKRCGCRWVAVERGADWRPIAATRYLRQAVQGPDFELVRSFEVDTPDTTHVDLYRLTGPIETPDKMEIPFPVLGADRSFELSPLELQR